MSVNKQLPRYYSTKLGRYPTHGHFVFISRPNDLKRSTAMFDIFISAAFVIFTSFFPHLVTQCFVYYKEKLNAVNEIPVAFLAKKKLSKINYV